MINKIKSIKKETFQLIAVGVLAVCLMSLFLYKNFFPNESKEINKDSEGVVLTSGGEASYMNLSIPSSKVSNDSLSMLENIERIKQDSINKGSIKDIGYIDNRPKIKVVNDYEDQKYNSQRNSSGITATSRGNSRYNNTYRSNEVGVENYENYSPAQKKIVVKENKSDDFGGAFFNLDAESIDSSSKFDDSKENLSTDRKIYACVHMDQLVMDNTRIKLRLTKNSVIDNISYPINTIIYGMAKISPNRLFVEITTINQNRSSNLELYDAEDSNKGIYVLTPILNASLKTALGSEVLQDENQDFDKIPFSKTLKSFFQKKIKEEKIELLNNYKVIIKKKQKNEN